MLMNEVRLSTAMVIMSLKPGSGVQYLLWINTFAIYRVQGCVKWYAGVVTSRPPHFSKDWLPSPPPPAFSCLIRPLLSLSELIPLPEISGKAAQALVV